MVRKLLITKYTHIRKTGAYMTRPLGYERVYLPLYKVADTPFHIQRDDVAEGPHAAVSQRQVNYGSHMLSVFPGRMINDK